MKEIESVTECKLAMEEIKKNNPELAAKEDLRIVEQRSSIKSVIKSRPK